MRDLITFLICSTILLSSCSKTEQPSIVSPANEFIPYIIASGDHYCDRSTLRAINLSRQLFDVRFDSSAIYTTTVPVNQNDINKLYGFTEGSADPHINSARIGWSYNHGRLRLYAYAYKNGQRLSQEICPVNIGENISCSIILNGFSYIFTVNNTTVQLDRGVDLPEATGYQLYPYFGGDETAPHRIIILIRDLSFVN